MCHSTKFSRKIKWINKAIDIHGDKYDYDKVAYVDMQTPVTITCPIHGYFELKPSYHIRKITPKGCKECFENDRLKSVLDKFKEVHGDKYDYTKIIKIPINKHKGSVPIICPEHGIFTQRIDAHINGHGCSTCTIGRYYTTEEFINKAIDIHGDKYDYSITSYSGARNKVTIICSDHGKFQITAGHHIGGPRSGCQRCSRNSGFDYDATTLLYYLKINDPLGEFFKIGVTNNTLEIRYYKWERDNFETLWVKEYDRGEDALIMEQNILRNNNDFLVPNSIRNDIKSIKRGHSELFIKNVCPTPPF